VSYRLAAALRANVKRRVFSGWLLLHTSTAFTRFLVNSEMRCPNPREKDRERGEWEEREGGRG
jgi:hypothetical protein